MLSPLDKLPLVARKNIRDEFTSKVPELEKQLSDFLGETWTINVNELLIGAYADKIDESAYARRAPGALYYQYIEGFISSLKYTASSKLGFDDEEKGRKNLSSEINKLADKHVLTIEPDEEDKVNYCGCDVKDGVLRIIFKADRLGTNVSDAGDELIAALSAAVPTGKMSFNARMAIERDFDPKIKDIKEKVEKILNCTLSFVVDFPTIYDDLSKSDLDQDRWRNNLGSFTFLYFEAFLSGLQYQGFEGDDMMVEAFADAVDKKQIGFRIVKETKKTYNETVIEGGEVWMQCKADRFGTNISDVAEGLADLL